MVLVHPDAVEAQAVHLLPGVQVFGIGLDRRLRIEIAAAEPTRQLSIDPEAVEVGLVVHQVEDEDLHRDSQRRLLRRFGAPEGDGKPVALATVRKTRPRPLSLPHAVLSPNPPGRIRQV